MEKRLYKVKTIAIEDVISLLKYHKILYDAQDSLRELVFTRSGTPIEIKKEDLDEFEFTGLGIKDFVKYWLLTDKEAESIYGEVPKLEE